MGYPTAPHKSQKRDGYSDHTLDMDYIDDNMTFIPSERCTVSSGTVCVDPRASKVLIIFNRRLGIWQLPKGRKNIGEDLQSAALRETYEETGVRANLLPLKIRTRSTTQPNVINDSAVDATRRRNFAATHRTTHSAASVSSVSTAYSTSIMSTASTASSTPIQSYTPTLPEKGPLEVDGDGSVQSEKHGRTLAAEGQDFALVDGSAVETVPVVATVVDPKLTCGLFNSELVGVIQYPDLQAATPNTIKTVFFFAAFADSTAAMGPGAQEDHEDLRAEWVDFQIASQRLRFRPEKEAMWKVRQDMARSGL
ncbi:uncharacterized protein SPSK_03539 [Sporothrix schenckii 1099-18]|uniref:Nudix hydrolase domain-containing protein n=1 Tax=Sporothrix schenckii 1099-18 TaxID=1397361 RepID=A0A0F2M1L0_SPOSC|nr:uncharacterized protein SPSK_03539 [Sporothrix schenckii 1099-18]KJR82655.1 hypothetical protein SPSK_03539 [Sporothrix schenckii 1099-18]